jgi:DNA-directed RNA polymerase sigma subunit (sigma70/sigma32)
LSELAEALEMEESTLTELFLYDSDAVSLDAAIGEDGSTTLGDLVARSSDGSPFELVAQAMLGSHIDGILEQLCEAERQVLLLRYGLDRGEPRTQGAVGALLDLPADRVRRIEHDAMAKLRRALSGSDARDLLAS